MDAAAKPPWMGLRRLPQPDPPRHPTECTLLLLLLLLPLLRLVAGAGRSPAKKPYSCGSRVMWMSVGVDSGMFRSARICSRLKYRSLRVA